MIGRSQLALDLVDTLLRECAGREIMSASTVADALLDIRTAITAQDETEELDHAL